MDFFSLLHVFYSTIKTNFSHIQTKMLNAASTKPFISKNEILPNDTEDIYAHLVTLITHLKYAEMRFLQYLCHQNIRITNAQIYYWQNVVMIVIMPPNIERL